MRYYLVNPELSPLPYDTRRWARLKKYKCLFRFLFKLKTTRTLPSTHLTKNTSWYTFSKLLSTFTTNLTTDRINFLFFLYNQHYFSQLFKTPVLFKPFNSHKVVPKSLLAYMTHASQLIKWKRYYITHSNEIIEILFLCLWLKNLKLFMDWMRKHFEKTNLKKHRKLFLLLNLLIGRLVWNYNIFLQLKGLRVVLRGKFGKAGSVRKTRKYIRRGKCSYTTKNIGLINQTNIIRTLTGVFAIKFEVFF